MTELYSFDKYRGWSIGVHCHNDGQTVSYELEAILVGSDDAFYISGNNPKELLEQAKGRIDDL